jgi:hypothetical protein
VPSGTSKVVTVYIRGGIITSIGVTDKSLENYGATWATVTPIPTYAAGSYPEISPNIYYTDPD